MQTVVLKFGGSSLADSQHFEKVKEIILSSGGRRYVVASAPGKRSASDTKVTDMLYASYEAASGKRNFSDILEGIEKRFSQIVNELKIDFDLEAEIKIIEKHLSSAPDRDYMASRGEYLNSRILASYLGYEFIDPANYIFFDVNGNLNAEKTNELLGKKLSETEHAVIAGFYGSTEDGKIKTFSRGGSDITGAIAARAVKADVYENWTDVSGMLSADPRIVDNPRPIDTISYKELRELSYMGASVMHEDAVFPVRQAGIPINIRNTNRPQDRGTWIVMHHRPEENEIITGIAGKKGFSTILVEKAMMNNEVGFGARMLKIIASHGLSFEHLPSGIDTMSAVIETQSFRKAKTQILEEIKEELEPDTVVVESGLVLIAIVGIGMVYRKGVAAKIFNALAEANVNIRMIDQGSSEINIIIGVDESDYEKAVNAVYSTFFNSDKA